VNHQSTLAARAIGEPTESDFTLVEVPAREPAEGEVLVRTRWEPSTSLPSLGSRGSSL